MNDLNQQNNSNTNLNNDSNNMNTKKSNFFNINLHFNYRCVRVFKEKIISEIYSFIIFFLDYFKREDQLQIDCVNSYYEIQFLLISILNKCFDISENRLFNIMESKYQLFQYDVPITSDVLGNCGSNNKRKSKFVSLHLIIDLIKEIFKIYFLSKNSANMLSLNDENYFNDLNNINNMDMEEEDCEEETKYMDKYKEYLINEEESGSESEASNDSKEKEAKKEVVNINNNDNKEINNRIVLLEILQKLSNIKLLCIQKQDKAQLLKILLMNMKLIFNNYVLPYLYTIQTELESISTQDNNISKNKITNNIISKSTNNNLSHDFYSKLEIHNDVNYTNNTNNTNNANNTNTFSNSFLINAKEFEEFCKLIFSLKSNFNIKEIIIIENSFILNVEKLFSMLIHISNLRREKQSLLNSLNKNIKEKRVLCSVDSILSSTLPGMCYLIQYLNFSNPLFNYYKIIYNKHSLPKNNKLTKEFNNRKIHDCSNKKENKSINFNCSDDSIIEYYVNELNSQISSFDYSLIQSSRLDYDNRIKGFYNMCVVYIENIVKSSSYSSVSNNYEIFKEELVLSFTVISQYSGESILSFLLEELKSYYSKYESFSNDTSNTNANSDTSLFTKSLKEIIDFISKLIINLYKETFMKYFLNNRGLVLKHNDYLDDSNNTEMINNKNKKDFVYYYINLKKLIFNVLDKESIKDKAKEVSSNTASGNINLDCVFFTLLSEVELLFFENIEIFILQFTELLDVVNDEYSIRNNNNNSNSASNNKENKLIESILTNNNSQIDKLTNLMNEVFSIINYLIDNIVNSKSIISSSDLLYANKVCNSSYSQNNLFTLILEFINNIYLKASMPFNTYIFKDFSKLFCFNIAHLYNNFSYKIQYIDIFHHSISYNDFNNTILNLIVNMNKTDSNTLDGLILTYYNKFQSDNNSKDSRSKNNNNNDHSKDVRDNNFDNYSKHISLYIFSQILETYSSIIKQDINTYLEAIYQELFVYIYKEIINIRETRNNTQDNKDVKFKILKKSFICLLISLLNFSANKNDHSEKEENYIKYSILLSIFLDEQSLCSNNTNVTGNNAYFPLLLFNIENKKRLLHLLFNVTSITRNKRFDLIKFISNIDNVNSPFISMIYSSHNNDRISNLLNNRSTIDLLVASLFELSIFLFDESHIAKDYQTTYYSLSIIIILFNNYYYYLNQHLYQNVIDLVNKVIDEFDSMFYLETNMEENRKCYNYTEECVSLLYKSFIEESEFLEHNKLKNNNNLNKTKFYYDCFKHFSNSLQKYFLRRICFIIEKGNIHNTDYSNFLFKNNLTSVMRILINHYHDVELLNDADVHVVNKINTLVKKSNCFYEKVIDVLDEFDFKTLYLSKIESKYDAIINDVMSYMRNKGFIVCEEIDIIISILMFSKEKKIKDHTWDNKEMILDLVNRVFYYLTKDIMIVSS